MSTYRIARDAVEIDGYLQTRPFASFLPSIAGLRGLPMWAFYVNRGQAIAGFGIQDKDHPLMEFLPANKAYRTAALHGFRTFLKLKAGGRAQVHEPFQPAPGAKGVTQRLRIHRHALELFERHDGLRLDTAVQYFTIPNKPFAGLARLVTFTNRGRGPVEFELLDGLPILIPHGMLDRFLKNMSRTIEAWVQVENLRRGAPFAHLKVEPHDRPEVVPIREGNFFVAGVPDRGRLQPLAPVIDPALVFGFRDDLTQPERFLAPGFRVPAEQPVVDKTPSGMVYGRLRLKPGDSRTLYSLYGHMPSLEALNRWLPTLLTEAFFTGAAQENAALIDGLTQPIATASGSPAFDLYCRQSFLDNLMRGGVPVAVGGKRFYVFSRKHGDLERDYNFFVVPASYYSQGNANYRDVNQNRRNDPWFYPGLGDANVRVFFNLIQADGFNPLVFKGVRYVAAAASRTIPALEPILSKPFTPGELLMAVERQRVTLPQPVDRWLEAVMAAATPIEDAEHGEGFWTDHWTYNLDLLRSLFALYPERVRGLLLEQRDFTFYDNPHVVAPRAKKYQLVHGAVRQFHAVRRDAEKAELIQARGHDHRVHVDHGRGAVYTTTLLVKMLVVAANKLASLDPSGLGIEMDSEKPNWYDALNGLPGLLGSSLCETFELKGWLQFLLDALRQSGVAETTTILVPTELAELMRHVEDALEEPPARSWDRATTAKEAYREQTRLGFAGSEAPLTLAAVRQWLQRALAKVEDALARGFDPTSGLYPSYFYHEVTAHAAAGLPPAIAPTAWHRHTLPPFLEGMVHALRYETDPTKARALVRAVRRSPLYDRALKMYRVCAPLEGESEEIGRCRVFTPGWLENESIWLHMEYKYLLELLRTGLYEKYYEDFFQALIPFQPPARYGRSILENSSFLVSSAYPDAALHGAGFVARLSGATAEFLHLWLWMALGRQPFRLDGRGRLALHLAPILDGRLFDAKGLFRCTLLGSTALTYRNPARRSTFGTKAVRPGIIRLTPRRGGEPIVCNGAIPAPYAEQVRRGEFAAIEVDLVPAPRPAAPAPQRAKR
jgi:hypothetical protein